MCNTFTMHTLLRQDTLTLLPCSQRYQLVLRLCGGSAGETVPRVHCGGCKAAASYPVEER